ncbi:serine/threonine-protein kinase [Dactylosporangium sp. NPDC049742]|uniref:serine/threonine-protein kinase n=1 Tax=Dactylosporangium sp. NPDC049742 TaxID=3154737 RepID=UPI00341FD87D
MGELLLGGRYHLEELLGSGGMSVVWRARDEVLHRAVAVKVLHLNDDRQDGRIRAEARAAAALSHPNLAQVHDFGEDGFPFLVMELVEGRTLQQHIDDGPMPPAEVFRVCAGVAAGLAAAHEAGLVHQDVKPANIMVTPAGAKLVDFGLATPAGSRLPDDVLGTPAYLAPERLTGQVAPPSDVYALGVLLYRLLSGELPWTAETTTQLIRDHVFTPPLPLPPLPGVPDAVARLCMASLAKDPAGRPSASAAAGVLAAAAATGTTPTGAVAAPVPVEAAATGGGGSDRGGRGRRFALAALVLLVAAAFPWILAALDGAGRRDTAGAATSDPAHPDAQRGTLPGGAGPGGTASTGATGSQGPGPGLPPQPWGGTPATTPAGPATPTGPTTPTGGTTPPRTAGPTPQGTAPVAFTTEAGTVQAACAGAGRVRIVTVTVTRPYKTETRQDGPAATAFVELRHGNDLLRMTFTCPSGEPVMNVTRSTR